MVFGVKLFKIYPEMTPQPFCGKNMVLVDYIGIFLHVAMLLAEYCIQKIFGLLKCHVPVNRGNE